jgi:hypothetical protein
MVVLPNDAVLDTDSAPVAVRAAREEAPVTVRVVPTCTAPVTVASPLIVVLPNDAVFETDTAPVAVRRTTVVLPNDAVFETATAPVAVRRATVVLPNDAVLDTLKAPVAETPPATLSWPFTVTAEPFTNRVFELREVLPVVLSVPATVALVAMEKRLALEENFDAEEIRSALSVMELLFAERLVDPLA